MLADLVAVQCDWVQCPPGTLLGSRTPPPPSYGGPALGVVGHRRDPTLPNQVLDLESPVRGRRFATARLTGISGDRQLFDRHSSGRGTAGSRLPTVQLIIGASEPFRFNRCGSPAPT